MSKQSRYYVDRFNTEYEHRSPENRPAFALNFIGGIYMAPNVEFRTTMDVLEAYVQKRIAEREDQG